MKKSINKTKKISLDADFAQKIGLSIFRYLIFPKEKFIFVNNVFSQMLGYNSKDLKKIKMGQIFFDYNERNTFFHSLCKNKKIKFFETRLKKNNGEEIFVEISAIKTKQENKEFIDGLVKDISFYKKNYLALLQEKNFFQGLLDNIPDAVYFKDKDNRIIKVNKFYSQGFGLPEEEIIGKTDFDFFPYEQAKEMFEDDNFVLKTAKPIIGKIEKTYLPNKTWNQVITTKIPIFNNRGEVIGTMGITRDMTTYANLQKQKLDMVINALRVLGKTLQMRDPYTFGHTHRVADIATFIARKLNWDENHILCLRLAGELHDIGKISIPLAILNKPGKLSSTEYALIKEHVNKSYELIKDINFPFPLAKAIYQHHERLDGSGYPHSLKESDIIMEARILAVCDVLEAMTHHRPYREALGIDVALDEIKKGRGIKYDARIVDTVFDMVSSDSKLLLS